MCIRPKGMKELPKMYLGNNPVKKEKKYIGSLMIDDGSDDDDILR